MKYGVRISALAGTGRILVMQTQFSEKSREYVKSRKGGKYVERHVDEDNDAEVARLIRDALRGKLSRG